MVSHLFLIWDICFPRIVHCYYAYHTLVLAFIYMRCCLLHVLLCSGKPTSTLTSIKESTAGNEKNGWALFIHVLSCSVIRLYSEQYSLISCISGWLVTLEKCFGSL